MREALRGRLWPTTNGLDEEKSDAIVAAAALYRRCLDGQ